MGGVCNTIYSRRRLSLYITKDLGHIQTAATNGVELMYSTEFLCGGSGLIIIFNDHQCSLQNNHGKMGE